jgi:Zn-dependent protease with chaperone function
MFAARGIAVSFSVFFLIYVVLSLAVCSLWRKVYAYGQKLSPRHCADLLFTLRIFPLTVAAVVTAAFTVPSFLLLEPRAIEEPLGGLPLALGVCGLSLALFGAANAVAALIRTSRLIARWTSRAKAVEAQASVPVLRINGVVPALTAAGILRPRVLLSGAAEFVLNQNELQTALRHEVAHVRRRDNLRKLLLRFVIFPGMKNLETAWLNATEMAADDAAVDNAGEALDLAAALIKLSKMSATQGRFHQDRPSELMTAFVYCSVSLLNARVERLIAWNEYRPAARKYSPRRAVGVTLAATITIITAFALTYSQLLAQVHAATEWLVR